MLLLSICIPTYNGTKSYFGKVLNNTIALAEMYPGEVEVVVSDNASTDNTQEILSVYNDKSCLRCYRNEENLGFHGNLKALTDKYSRGKYTWMIGDDDFIIPSVFPTVFDALKNGTYDYVSLGSKIIHAEELESTLSLKQTYEMIPSTYAKAVDINCYDGNVLSTFIGASIFLTSLFREFPKDFLKNTFEDYKSIFPNGYILSSVYYNSAALCIPQVSVVSIAHEKAWATSDNVYFIYTKHLPQLYNCLINKGVNKKELTNTHKTILYKSAMLTLLRIRHKQHVRKAMPLFFRLLLCPSVLKRVVVALL